MYKCARCGRGLNITEYVQHNRLFLACGTEVVLHFCSSCVIYVDRREK